MTRGAQGGKREKACYLISELNLVLVEHEDGKRGSGQVPHHKMPMLDQVEMAIVKVEKATANKVDEAKKLAEQMAVVEVSSTKKLPRTPKGEREKSFGPLNPESGQGRALMEKESSKGEASKGEAYKDNAQVVKQLGSTFDSSKSNEEEDGNLKGFNITKKPIRASKQMEEPIKAQEANPSSEKGPKGKAATYG
ncbi:unnamed protein product [Sphagnum jensenii]|uniref:Uncharacterized protein n=1 Tax=Sphagnum jensenii TaxID=128206 RepID=A0ABP0WVF7_9BRYO